MMPAPAIAEAPTSAQSAAIAGALRETGAQGLAIALIEDGRVSWVRSFGVRNAAGDPLQTDTVMYGASLTKAVVDYLTVQLAAEGVVELDKPIAGMLPKPLPEYGNVDAYGNWGDLAGDRLPLAWC